MFLSLSRHLFIALTLVIHDQSLEITESSFKEKSETRLCNIQLREWKKQNSWRKYFQREKITLSSRFHRISSDATRLMNFD